jgi:hypothetical protein
MKKKNRRFMALAVVLALVFAAAGCVQPSGGAEETVAVDPETGEQLVTVRIPTNAATGARALTLAQAQIGIDFYEVVFKRTDPADGRIYVASATKDKVLTIQLPPATYATVLLAGTSTGTLLASAYKASQLVESNTKTIPYDLLALDVAVNAPTNKVAFTTPVLPSPSGRTKDGSPYFSLPEGAAGAGTITIGNFPNSAIFDTVIAGDSAKINSALVPAFGTFGALDLVRLLTAYKALQPKAKAFSDAAEDAKNFDTEANAKIYLAAASGAGALYEEMASLADQIATADPVTTLGTLNSAITTAKDGSWSFDNPAATTAWGVVEAAFDNSSVSETAGKLWPVFSTTATWTTVAEDLAALGAAYITAAAAIEGGNYTAANISAVNTATTTVTKLYTADTGTILLATSPDNLQAAFAAADAAITATTRVTMGSLGVDSTGGNPSGSTQPIILPFAGGWVATATGTVNFALGTPSLSGLTKLYYEFAFKALGSSSANTWRIRDGLDNFYVDTGSNSGASILLSVGSAASDGIIIIKNGP